MPYDDDNNYIPSSGEEEDARESAARARGAADATGQRAEEVSPRRVQTNNNNAQPRQIFKDAQGHPICFFFDAGVRAQVKQSLSSRIRQHGGQVVPTDERAHTVLVRHDFPEDELKAKQAAYRHSDNQSLWDIWVERTSFVKDCIASGRYRHKRKRETHRGLRGRTEYTPADDEHLCKFLWKETTQKGGKGRTALGMYKRMVAMAEYKDEHRWAARHPAESWRNRYKSNKVRMDERIQEIADEASEDLRQHVGRDPRVRRRDDDDDDEDEEEGNESEREDEADEEEEEEDEEEEEEERPRQRRRITGNTQSGRARQAQPTRARAAPASQSRRASGFRISRANAQPASDAEDEEEEEEEDLELEEVQEELAEEEGIYEYEYQGPDSLFDGPYDNNAADEPTLPTENTQTTLVDISATTQTSLPKSTSNTNAPANANIQGALKPTTRAKQGKAALNIQEQRSPVRFDLPPPAPVRIGPPRKAARRPKAPAPPSPPVRDEEEEEQEEEQELEDEEEVLTHSSPMRPRDESSPVRRQPAPSRARTSQAASNAGRNAGRERSRLVAERPPSFADRRLTLPRPIIARASPHTDRGKLPRQSMPLPRPHPHPHSQGQGQGHGHREPAAQNIYPIISPSHRVIVTPARAANAMAMATPTRGRVSMSSNNSDDSSNFPVPGTKADSLTKFLVQEVKRTPYTPAPGTRAAAYLTPTAAM